MYQKHVKSVFNLLSNFDCLKSVSKFSKGGQFWLKKPPWTPNDSAPYRPETTGYFPAFLNRPSGIPALTPFFSLPNPVPSKFEASITTEDYQTWCDLEKLVWSLMWHFQFSIWLKFSFGEVDLAENPTWIEPVFPKLWTIEGFSKQMFIRKQKKFIPFSGHISQSMLLTSDWFR